VISPERHRRARRATLTGIAGNTILFVVKATIGVASGSIALLSDAFNSLVDVMASIAIWYSVHVAEREPDADHPFGHQRAETIAALAVAIFTAILGFEIGRSAVERLIGGPRPIELAGWAIGALVFSMAGNLALARYLRRRGEELESPAILANAVECENDIWTSLAAQAHWGVCLARTNPDGPQHQGITYFLVDMKSPGIDIRPLREITGERVG